MITNCSKAIIEMLTQRSKIISTKEQQAVYIYGLECLLNTGLTLLVLLIWGISTNSLLEILIWLTAFSVLRHHTGGYHAPTQFACILSSSLLGISNCLLVNIITFSNLHLLFIYILCLAIILLFTPVKTVKKNLNHKMQIQQKLISSFFLLLGYFAIYIFPARINFSITYAYVCVILLVLISLLKNNF